MSFEGRYGELGSAGGSGLGFLRRKVEFATNQAIADAGKIRDFATSYQNHRVFGKVMTKTGYGGEQTSARAEQTNFCDFTNGGIGFFGGGRIYFKANPASLWSWVKKGGARKATRTLPR